MTSTLRKHQAAVVYSGAIVTSLYAGLLVSRNQEAMTMSMIALLALGGLIVLVNLPVRVLFCGWLTVAPLLQALGTDLSSLGRGLTWALYITPALLFVALTVARRQHALAFSVIDLFPAAYVAFVVTSIWLTSDLIQSNPTGAAKSIVTLVAMGPIVYYFLTRGPGLSIPLRTVVVVLMAAAVVQGVFAVFDMTIHWNLWNDFPWRNVEGGARAVATLSNPGVLGMFLGLGIVSSVAILTWDGPRALRRPAWVVLLVATPGLFLTLTRGPILATAIAVVLLLLLGRARMVGLGVLAAAAVGLALLLPTLQDTTVYRERATNSSTVQVRVALRDLSLRLAADKPAFGWGYGKFDEVKNESTYTFEGFTIQTVQQTTSHDTYLTILVELGLVGFFLYFLPFGVLAVRGIRSRVPPGDRWLLATALGSLLCIYLTASTLDLRFFSFALMTPFIFLAMLRRMTDPRQPEALRPQ